MSGERMRMVTDVDFRMFNYVGRSLTCCNVENPQLNWVGLRL